LPVGALPGLDWALPLKACRLANPPHWEAGLAGLLRRGNNARPAMRQSGLLETTESYASRG
jgi:hypothetical protein